MKSAIFILFILFFHFCHAQIIREKLLGGSRGEGYSGANNIFTEQTPDGGYIMMSCTNSYDGDISGYTGGDSEDIWVVKLSNTGAIEWQQCLGGSNSEYALCSMRNTLDGGYILAVYTTSKDGEVTGNHLYQTGASTFVPSIDVWVVKLSHLGEIEWKKCLGGSGSDYINNIFSTDEGGFVLVASTSSFNGDVQNNHGQEDIWIVKLSSVGAIEWQKCLGGSQKENIRASLMTSDGGLLISSWTLSTNGDVATHSPEQNTWIVKLSKMGAIEWQKCLGYSSLGFSQFTTLKETSEGNYVLAGLIDTETPVNGTHGQQDIWVMQLSNTGNVVWEKFLGTTEDEQLSSFALTSDLGCILLSYTTFDSPLLVTKIDNTGSVEWQKSLEKKGVNTGIVEMPNKGYLLVNATIANEGTLMEGYSSSGGDSWVMKLSSFGTVEGKLCIGGGSQPKFNGVKNIGDNRYLLTGTAFGSINGMSSHGYYDIWMLELNADILNQTSPVENSGILVYPNPVLDNKLNISYLAEGQGEIFWEIYDIWGRILFGETEQILLTGVQNKEVSLINFASGIYFVKVKTPSQTYLTKIVKK
jgi:hypothetical protein